MEFEVSAELVGVYLEDAREHLAILDAALLRMEREGASAELAASLLGPLHTLKGNSGMIGFTAIKDYVHRLEEVLQRVRDGSLELTGGRLDRLLDGASALRASVESASASGAETRDLALERAALVDLLETGAVDSSAGAAAAAPSVGAATASRSAMVRVDFAKLDQLLNLVGELIVQRTKLQEAGRTVASAAPAAGHELVEAVHQVSSVSTMLQETIMDIRMLPIRHVFERFPRLVRDLARAQGKQVELILQGEQTRVDKAIIDEIGEPLVHLMRNAVDHGLEPPQARVARGKSATGTILLQAAQESSQVVITVVDDGAGIDVAAVRSRALERGLLRPDEPLGDRDVIQLIFAPGFSTASTVTDVSGRGVGLDVVVRCMERLNGLIEAESLPGAGTKFTLQLPLTLAIISVLMVEVGGRTYALPSGAVVESLRFAREDVVTMNGRDTLRVRDRIVPLLHLDVLFGHERRAGAGEAYAVLVGRGEKRLGLTVDRLLGQQDVVIKALDPLLSGAALGIAGATILGDGRVVLILDVAQLFEGRGRRGAARGEA